VSFAQVGLGTENPQSKLHIAGGTESADGLTPGALAAGDGVIVSRVTNDLSSGAVATTAVVGSVVFSTNGAGGFYYSTGAVWTAVGGGGASGPDFTVNGIISGSSSFDFSSRTENVFNITSTTGGPGTDNITMPDPTVNTGRMIMIKNNGTKPVDAGFGETILATYAKFVVSDGTEWVML
jgi:hypothetical protein